MNTYYEIRGNIDGQSEQLFGSFSKDDCTCELVAERDSWKDQGYTSIKLTHYKTDDKPDPEVYADDDDVVIDEPSIDDRIAELRSQYARTIGHNKRDRIQSRIDKLIAERDGVTDEPAPVGEGTHFYATCAIGWATADTRDAAIRKLVNSDFSFFKDSIKASQKRGDAGAYIWACQVNVPADADYRIEFYQPVGVETEAGAEHFVTHLTRKEIAYTNGAK